MNRMLLLAALLAACPIAQGQTGTPWFQSSHTGYVAGGGSWVLADLEGDGVLDLVSFLSAPVGGTHMVFVRASFLRDGLLSPSTYVPAPHLAGTLCRPKGGDVDGNGTIDIFGSLIIWGPLPYSALVQPDLLYLTDTAGNLTESSGRLPTQPTFLSDAAFVDVDGDGDLDLFLAGIVPGNLLYLNDGRGYFTDATASRLPVGTTLFSTVVVPVDFDRDGDQDVLVGYQGGTPALYVNDGRGFFSLGTVGSAVGEPVFAATGDLDGDGLVEIVLAHGNRAPDILVWSGGTTLTVVSWALPSWFDLGVKTVFVFDMDGDGDVLVGRSGAAGPLMGLAENRGGGVFTDASSNLPSGPGGRFTNVFDYDGDGDPDISTRWGTGAVLLANTQRHLLPRNDPRLGATWQVAAFGMPGHVLVHGIAFGAVGTRIPGLGWLWLDPNALVVFGLGTYQRHEEQTLNLAVPPLASLVGVEVCLQSLDIDTVTGAVHLTNSPCRRIQ